MLGKLLILAGLLLTALAARFAITRLYDWYRPVMIIGTFVVVAYFLAILAAGALTLVTLVYRFYRSLLSDEGCIRTLKTPGGNRYDDRRDEHAHLICTSCGAVRDVEIRYDAHADAIAMEETGFSQVTHYAFFEGICPACQARQSA